MKYFNAFLLLLLIATSCVKAPAELERTFWDPETEVINLATVLDSSYQLNSINERYYSVTFSIDWDRVPTLREDNILSVNIYNNGRNIPLPFNSANRIRYEMNFFAKPAETTCITFGFLTSNGGNTRLFDMFCVEVP